MTIETKQSKQEKVQKTQEFSQFMSEFLTSKSADTVVEIGSDVKLRIASNLALFCQRLISVNLKEDYQRIKNGGWYRMHQEMGNVHNIELVGGNAVRLREVLTEEGIKPQADVIILHNVLLDLTGDDSELLWKYRKGELEHTDEEWNAMVHRFDRAEEQAYQEFLHIANPGHIINFQRSSQEERFTSFLTEGLQIPSGKIGKKELFYDGSKDLWHAFIINNT